MLLTAKQFLSSTGEVILPKAGAVDLDFKNVNAHSFAIRSNWYIGILAVSISFSLTAVGVFVHQSTLRVTKFRIIIMLIGSLIVRDIFAVVNTILVKHRITVLLTCKVMLSIEKLAGTLVYTCLLLEAIFLYRLLTNVFIFRRTSRPLMRWFCLGGAVVALASTTLWTIGMTMYRDYDCWLREKDKILHWIYNGPRLGILLMDVVVITYLIIILWKTFRYKPSEQHVAIRTARANLYSVPVFILHLLSVIMYQYPDADSTAADFYYYFIYTLEGLQGVCVVLFHFYSDRAVLSVLASYYRKIAYYFSRHFYKRKFVIDITPTYNENRSTWSTTLDDNSLDFTTDHEIVFGHNKSRDENLASERTDTLPNLSEAKSMPIQFYVDSLDRKNYHISLSSLNSRDDESLKQEQSPQIAVLKVETINVEDVEPVVVRHSDGFWFHRNRKLYLKDESETGKA